MTASFILIFHLSFVLYFLYQRRQHAQLAYIRTFIFPNSIKLKLKEKHPQLSSDQIHLVLQALREYFFLCSKARRQRVAMPSQVVDDAWHEFILFTRSYKKFCRKALGRFLHYTPSAAMSSQNTAQEGINRAWRLACAREKIDPRTPEKLPLLFEIDSRLNIKNGFHYTLNYRDETSGLNQSSPVYCPGHIKSAGGYGGSSRAANSSGSGVLFENFFESSTDCGGD